MSQSVSRKDSLGANSRRGPQKAHIPYRGDDLVHGKKTGKTVDQVPHDDDDFEPFEQVLGQAYKGGNAPRPKANGRHVPSPILENYDDSGELSMDIDSAPNSPTAYFNSTAAPQPSSAQRAGSSSRPLPRRSTVDYDRVPSPKSFSRRSSVPSRAYSQPSNPSRLRHELQADDDTFRGGVANPSAGVDDDQFGPRDDDENFPVDEEPSLNMRSNMSFTELAEDVEEDVSEEEPSPVPKRSDKGKGRAQIHEELEEQSDDVEDDIRAGLLEVEGERYEDEEPEDLVPSSKKARQRIDGSPSNSAHAEKLPKRNQTKRTEAKPRISMHETLNDDGLRRSRRRHYPPLEYWRQEKVVWGRRENGRSVVPVIKEIITIPKPPPEPLGAKKRKRAGTRRPRSHSKSLPAPDVQVVAVDNPELGWDDDTNTQGIILDYYTREDVERRVAFTARMVEPKKVPNSNYTFQKIFGDSDFIAAGQLIIPPGEQKPTKMSKDNTYVFYVIEGAVQYQVHRSVFVLATGGMFLVPRGNQYYIENICQRDAKLFFAQARKIPDSVPDEGAVARTSTGVSRAPTTPRSQSQGTGIPLRNASIDS